MKKKQLLLTALLLVAVAACGPKKEYLFNGENLDGWVSVLDTAAAPATTPTFYAENGLLCISGRPFGYLRTTQKYSSYVLHLEWRWAGGEAVDGGIFNFLQDGDKVWPLGLQLQMTPRDMGTLMGGIPMEGVEDRGRGFYWKNRLPKSSPEKPVGEWNEMLFTCEGNQIRVMMNGVLVNEAVCGEEEGYIGLQSEGGALELRNIYITRP